MHSRRKGEKEGFSPWEEVLPKAVVQEGSKEENFPTQVD